MSKLISLQKFIEKEYFIICPLLTTDQFISYCKDRSINTSRKQLEQLEKLGIFYPIVRVKLPKRKIKIQYVENGTRHKELGVLEDGEDWDGEIKEEYACFWFEKEYAEYLLSEDFLWGPSSHDFQEWEKFYDEDKREFIISYYSIFQCYTLYNLIRSTKIEIRAEWWYNYSDKDIARLTDQISDWAKNVIGTHKRIGIRGEKAPMVCQVLSNRFFPKTQSDRRTINISLPSHYHNWNWFKYCHNWDPESVKKELKLSDDDIKNLHQLLSLDAQTVDPLKNWYGLVSFVSLEQKKSLKGNALIAQLIYSMEHMVRLFYNELTGKDLSPPDESSTWKKNQYYGKGVTDDNLKYLEFLTNQYHLNPRPKLILVVEGNGEEEQFPRLTEELLGYNFSTLRIDVVNLNGIGGFTGEKRLDKYGALEKFIDYHHNRETIVFVVLDKEGRAETIKGKLIETKSKFYSRRTVTKADYIHLWDKKTIEFENFTFEEIAQAMSEISYGNYSFSSIEIKECYDKLLNKEGDHLGDLYQEKTGYDLSKPKLLKVLFDYIIKNADNEFDKDRISIRSITKVLTQIIKLASSNHPSTRLDTWENNQESGFFGDIKG